MTSLMDLAKQSRESLAVKQVADASDRMRRLESESERAFAEWAKAQEAAEDAGLVIDIKLQPGIAAAFSSWKQQRVAEETHRERLEGRLEGDPIPEPA